MVFSGGLGRGVMGTASTRHVQLVKWMVANRVKLCEWYKTGEESELAGAKLMEHRGVGILFRMARNYKNSVLV